MNAKQLVSTTMLLCVCATSSLLPSAVHAQTSDSDNRQKNKNTWRNIGGAAAAIAGYGLLKGNGTATLLGAAGTAYAANRYEQDRKSQDADKRAAARYHRRGNYSTDARKYYTYDGRLYYLDKATGDRHLAE